jgi:CheY-like chemotaxis protein
MPKTDDRFPAHDRKVLRRLDEAAIRQVMLGILATLASFVAIVWISDLWQTRPRLTVVFGVLMVVVGLLQFILVFGFDVIYPRGPQRWRRRLVMTLLLRAAVWSAFIVMLMSLQRSDGLFFLAMFLPLILGAALAATWLADIWTVRFYLAISLLPPALSLLLDRQPDSVLVAVFLLLFLYALVRVSDHHFRLFWRVLARNDAPASAAVVPAGNASARLLVRTAEEFRQPVANVADVLSLVASNRDDPALMASARRSAQQLVDRLEVLADAAALLRGERIPQPVAGSLRRRCEEVADDIGVVAADAGVLCTTHYAADLPARVRTDFPLLFRALRCLGVWVLEQMPANSELLLGFQVVPGQHEDRLRCCVDIRGLYLSPALRNGLDRAAQGNSLLDPSVPLPLAVAAELARVLGGRLLLTESGDGDALAVDVRLEIADHTEAATEELRRALKGHRFLLAGLTPAFAASVSAELDALGIAVTHVGIAGAVAAVTANAPRTLLMDGRDVAVFAQTLREMRSAGLSASLRIVGLSAGAEPPALPDDIQKLVSDWLRLPLGRRRLRQFLERIGGLTDAPAESAAKTQGALRVLVVEDNPVNQKVARSMLEKLGCDVEVLENGALAVDRVSRGGVDLVLMDGEMPGMDGAEATRRIRAREVEKNLPRLPIVAMTAHNGESEVAGFLAAGMDDCLAKPVSLASMAARIERYRQRR